MLINHNAVTFKQTVDSLNRISGPESEYIAAYTSCLASYAKQKNSSIIHAHSSYVNGIAAARAANSLNIKSCYEVRGLWHLSRAIKEPLFDQSEHFHYCEKMELLACQMVDSVFTLTETLKQWLVANGINKSKITVVPNGVNENNLPQAAQETSPKKLTLGFIGTITQYEGLDIVIHALLTLKELNIELLIVGKGQYTRYLKNLTQELKLTEKVKFLGLLPKEEVKDIYQHVDVIMVNRTRSLLTELVSPIKHIEAFSFGKPCIISNLAALLEAGKANVNSIVVEPDCIDATAIAIQTLYHDRELLKKLALNAPSIVQSDYNWNVIASRYLAVYNK